MSSPRRKKRRRPSPALITSLTVCALATAAGASLLAAATAQGVTPSSYEIHGFDTSNNNHGPSGRPIDFRQAAAAGQQFVFLKATEGVDFTDPWFVRDWQGARDAGLIRAPYHFFNPATGQDGAAQADLFIRTLRAQGYTGKNAGELPPVLDVEKIHGTCPSALNASQIKATLDRIRSAFGVDPIVYSSRPLVDECLRGDGSIFSNYKLWVPRYGSGADEPAAIPGAAQPWTFWQYTDQGHVPGVPSSAVDLNVFRGSLAELRGLAHQPGGDTPPPGTKTFPTWGTRWAAHATPSADSPTVGLINKEQAGQDRVTVDYQVNTDHRLCERSSCSTYMAHLTAPFNGFLTVASVDVPEERLPGVPVKGSDTPAPGGPSRAEMLRRAATWLTADEGHQVPYSQTSQWNGYRRDCSGYVSMTLGLGKPGLITTGLANNRSVTRPITLSELQPGDLLIDDLGDNNSRHVVIFEKWADAAHTSYWAYEQRGGHGTDHRVLTYGLSTGSEYKPYRPVNLVG